MYRVALKFDMSLDKTELEAICLQTDEIFESENISCEERELGKRVYVSSEENQAFGRIWAAIFDVKDTPDIAGNLQDATWQNGEKIEDLMTNFFESKEGLYER